MNVISLSYLSVNHVLICMNCYKCMAYSTIDLVGLVMGFVSVVLAFISIYITRKVHREVVSQAFKTKQSECMANLVRDMNEFEFLVIPNNTNDPEYFTVNLVGSLDIDLTECIKCSHDLSNNKSLISYSEDFSFKFMKEYISNAYIPKDISNQLYLFSPEGLHETCFSIKNGYINIYLKEANKIDGPVYQTEIKYADWETFVHNIRELKKMIDKWYCSKLGDKPNFISTHYKCNPCVE